MRAGAFLLLGPLGETEPMARRGGLGPQGHAAIARAVEAGNPAALPTPSPGEDAEQPGDFVPFESSRVIEAAYDPPSSRLYVRFVKPRPGGTPWTYEGVSEQEWHDFQQSESAGRFVNRILNGKNYHPGTWG